MTIAVVAEKPSVARDLAAVLGATKRGDGCLEGNGYVVTWAIGHLVALAQPHEIEPAWKRWSFGTLPMLPTHFPLVVVPETRDQFAVVRRILRDRGTDSVVCATDAGREGELIFRYVYEAAECKKPVQRLWISSLTPDAIREGFRRLEPARAYDGLADAAKGRSRADWLVGMNLSRAYSLAGDQVLSVGRVQTPTLAIVVERERAIRAFVPEDYVEVVATFTPTGAPPTPYEGTWTRPRAPTDAKEDDATLRRRLPADGREASDILARARIGDAEIESIRADTRTVPPPLLYDLTELQRHANRLFGMSAQRTLDLAQALYERHKVLSYPRTDSRHLTHDVAATLPSVVAAIAPRYSGLVAPGTGARALGRRFVDDAQVSDHHAIIPTSTRASSLNADEQKIYDLVCRRLLAAWHADHVYAVTHVVTAITSRTRPMTVDRFESRGTAVEQIGWKVLDVGAASRTAQTAKKTARRGTSEARDDDPSLPSGLTRGQPQEVLDARAVAKTTRPPPRLTDASLLTAMETAGRTLEERELSDAMKDLGLGTPATRAQIIETLLRREYVVREGKALAATDKGIGLIDIVHADVKSPAMTGEWEAKLKRLQRGQGDLPTFMASIEEYVREVVARVGTTAPSRPPPSRPQSALPTVEGVAPIARIAPARTSSRAVTPPHALRDLLRSAFGFTDFRPHQEAVCRAVTEGRDVLLVMPTGAGKSLCYQLPGLARAGTTLVVSPLIALMEDQVAKLVAQGIAAERIHSGRDRAHSRQACVDYLAGKLDFLFIAPERLRVPGFPELLAKRPPTLIAIDEAHCISQWGHDFRRDYRLLGERLPALRPAPIVALTATATTDVQDDIVNQLGLDRAARFIHGFRRTNLAIEVVELNPSERGDAVKALLDDRARRPAIVYAATRKSAEELACKLGSERRSERRSERERKVAAAYHAGMDAEARDRVQSAFLSGRLEVIVATTAFGMGIDKADVRTIVHAALPGSLEGYYQEIGRAGRDGAPASAILFHSHVDRKTHEFFLGRDYPDVAVLESIHGKLTRVPVEREVLRRKSKVAQETFDTAIEKLVVHGGAEEGVDGTLTRGAATWKKAYLAQRAHKVAQLDIMARYAQSHGCRMVTVVRHFGDQQDDGTACGLCDACAPSRCVARRFRAPSEIEQRAIAAVLAALVREDGQATGRLHRETFGDGPIDRRAFEHILGGLVRAGLVVVNEATFEKGGETIAYQRASLTPSGRAQGGHATEIALPIASTKKAGQAGKSGKSGKAGKAGQAGKTGKTGKTGKPAPSRGAAARKRAFFARKKARKT